MIEKKEPETYFDVKITLIVLGVMGILSVLLGLFTCWVFGSTFAFIYGSVVFFALGCILFFPVFGIHRTYKDSITSSEKENKS